MSDPKPQSDPDPLGDPKPETDPKPDGDPNPAAPGQEIGDDPGNAGRHPGMPPKVVASKSSRKNDQCSSVQHPARPPINDRNAADDRGAHEPASR